MEDRYYLIYQYDDVIHFLKSLEIKTIPKTYFKNDIKQSKAYIFEQNLKASVPQLLADNGRSVIYRPNDCKNITLRKVRVSDGDSGKSKGYRCYVLLDAKERIIILMAIYKHYKMDSFPKKDEQYLKEICKLYHVIQEG